MLFKKLYVLALNIFFMSIIQLETTNTVLEKNTLLFTHLSTFSAFNKKKYILWQSLAICDLIRLIVKYA